MERPKFFKNLRVHPRPAPPDTGGKKAISSPSWIADDIRAKLAFTAADTDELKGAISGCAAASSRQTSLTDDPAGT